MRRIIKEQGGFTFVEALVAMLMMLTVMFALYAIFDAGVRIFSFGNDKTEAVENARLGMERMEREIRAASPYDPTTEPTRDHLFFAYATPSEPMMPPEIPTSSANSVTFGNDFNGECGLRRFVAATGECQSAQDTGELISYYVNADRLLIRRSNNRFSSVIENAWSLEFEYFDAEGAEVFDQSEIEKMSITLVVRVDGRAQTLTTDVALRNRAD
ncbi:MAG: PilW family protein [Rubrobacteraceae bacterium]